MSARGQRQDTDHGHPTTAAADASGRVLWVEAVRWIAAIAVVFQHAVAPLLDEAFATGSASVAWFIHALLRFPVPVFFFLSGFVAGHRLQAQRPPRYLTRFLRSAIPYAVYSVLYSTLAWVAGDTRGLDALDILKRVVLSDDGPHLWFLASLAVVGPLGVFLWRRIGDLSAYVAATLALVLGSIYSYSMVWKSPASTSVRMLFVPLGLYTAGLWWAAHRNRIAPRANGALVGGLAGVFIALSVVEMYVAELWLEPHWRLSQQWYASLALAAVLICVTFDVAENALLRLRALRTLAVLSPLTLGVYCLHPALLFYLWPLPDMTHATTWTALLAGLIAAPLAALAAGLLARSATTRRLVM